MNIRILLFIAAVFFGGWFAAHQLNLPLDGFLTGLISSLIIIVALFSHYRKIGLLRSAGNFSEALKHLKLWRFLLPPQAYHQLRLQILAESTSFDRALSELQKAEEKKLLDPAFYLGFRAEVFRRMDNPQRAEESLLNALNYVPPGSLRAGILTQLAHLYATEPIFKRELHRAPALLDEAENYSLSQLHLDLIRAVRGEVHLAAKEYQKAKKLLSSALSNLLPHRELQLTKGQNNGPLNKLLTILFFGDDGHQFPLYAELTLSLAKTLHFLGKKEQAKDYIQTALVLSKQPFIEKRASELKKLTN